MGGGCGSSASTSFCLSFKTTLGTLIIVLGFIFVMSVEIVQSEGNKTTTSTTIKTSDDDQSSISTPTGKLQQQEQVKVLGRVVHPLPDLNYMSKRRVPNGPDPIHNRRAGNSRRPPGQT